MAGISKGSFEEPDDKDDYGAFGDAAGVTVEGSSVWRSRLLPGWSWDEHIKPFTNGLESCPMYHREYVISGRIRYLTEDGTEVVAEAGDHLAIEPGHRAWVVGDEPCVLLDW